MRWLAVAVVGLGVLALPAQAADGSGNAAVTIRLLAVNGTLKVVTDKVPKNRPSKGDVVEERTTLKNAVRQFGKPKGAVVGSDVGRYIFTSATTASIKLTVKLPGGTLRCTSRVTATAETPLKVVGGTGAFAGARGTGAITPAPAALKGAYNTYRLQLP